jgi:o-succinylbenzoate synthase
LSGGPLVSISLVELREIRMRLLHPFETSFGVTQDRRILLVKVSDGQLEGYGEVTAGEGPFYCHETVDTAWHILSDFICPRLVGKTIEKPEEFASVVEGIRGHNMAKGGLEAALWDLEAHRQDKPLWKLIGGSREEIDCGVSIGIQPTIDRLLEVIQKEIDAGYRRIKIKIKPGWDVEVVRQVRAAFPKVLLMCDANSAYTLNDIGLFRRMDQFEVMMFEQPLHYEDMIDHAELQRQIRTPICLDESIHSADDARKAIKIGACRIINIKLGRVGGHREARAVHDVCQGNGIPVWCGGMLESGIGRAHNIALSSLENFSLPGDVAASKRYWAEDVIDPAVVVSSEGRITQTARSGIGYQVKETFLKEVTVRTQVFGT